MTAPHDARARALSAFQGLALGDALGMPTQSLSRARIRADYGAITGLLPAGPHQRIAAGLPAGSVTDDTEQAVLLARLLLDGHGIVDPLVYAARLLEWEAGMRERGSLDLLGPSTRAALQRLQDGVPPDEAGRFGTTNGAAMRVTPVGIAVPVEPLAAFVDAVAAAGAVTHNTGLGIAAAAAVGAAVSAGVDGASREEALRVAIAAAREGAGRGHWAAGGDVAARVEWAIGLLRSAPPERHDDLLADVVGTSVAAQESVVAALALAAVADDPWQALCRAAGLGGDTDTVAAMAGAVLGATHGPGAWPETELATVLRVSGLELQPLVDGLLALRGRAAPRHAERPAPRLLHTGSVVVDLVLGVDTLPAVGGDVFASSSRVAAGGGFTVMAAAARDGADVVYAGRLGTGPFGDVAARALAQEGIATPLPRVADADTGSCVVLVHPDAERTFVTAPGAEGRLTSADLDAVEVGDGDLVFVSGYSLGHDSAREAMLALVTRLPERTRLLFDPSPLVHGLDPDAVGAVLTRSDVVSANAREAEALTGSADPAAAAALLRRRSARPGAVAIVRAGADGCWVARGDADPVHVQSPVVRAVDTTGAGDTHDGVLAAALLRGEDVLPAARRANVAAALSVTRAGPGTAPTAAELDAALDAEPETAPDAALDASLDRERERQP